MVSSSTAATVHRKSTEFWAPLSENSRTNPAFFKQKCIYNLLVNYNIILENTYIKY